MYLGSLTCRHSIYQSGGVHSSQLSVFIFKFIFSGSVGSACTVAKLLDQGVALALKAVNESELAHTYVSLPSEVLF